MRATKFKLKDTDGGRMDELADYLRTDEGAAAARSLDGAWGECMRIASEHGYVTHAYGGVAVLATNEEYLRQFGADRLADRMRMCGVDVPVGGDA